MFAEALTLPSPRGRGWKTTATCHAERAWELIVRRTWMFG
jgi:hypothetical protein